MKRGWITWDKTEISPAVFERRLQNVRRLLSEQQLAALLVYSDLWRSNQARFLSNYMPYFNRALLVLPLEGQPALLCGLTPRVYGWIRSVTIIEDIRPAGNFAKPLLQLATERNWRRIGILDDPQMPYDIYKAIHTGALEVVSVDAAAVFAPGEDETELALRRKAAAMAREILTGELPGGLGGVDHRFIGALEKRFRRAGVEDLIALLTNGRTPPAPPTGIVLEENYSVSLAVEYRGHWIRLARPQGASEILLGCEKRFQEFLDDRNPVLGMTAAPAPAAMASRLSIDGATRPVSAGDFGSVCLENLSGPYPYETGPGSIFALHIEFRADGKRLFYGDTCWYSESGPKPL